jgi:outer membrane lipoprotein LolB
LLAVSALVGCASTPPTITELPADLTQLQHWEARGRIGVSGGGQGGSGSFDWLQARDRADVQIRGPIGIGSIRLQMSGSAENPELRLETGNGQIYRADTAWRELELRLGTRVPAEKLRYWMLGIPAPGEHHWPEARSGDGVSSDSAVLEQDGWRIEYRYLESLSARLPQRIHATSGDARVRIVIDSWSRPR